MVQQRNEGHTVLGRATIKALYLTDTDAGTSTGIQLNVLASELNKFNNSPSLGTPIFSGVGGSCGVPGTTGSGIYRAVISSRVATLGDTGLSAQRGTFDYHLEDTAGALLSGALLNGASAGGLSSGLAQAGIVLSYAGGTTAVPVNQWVSGKLITNSTGAVALILTSTGAGSAFNVRLFVHLANGALVAGSSFVFT